ncbi:hypothetical protein DSO57_1026924 [Entomophthora muscae]|uniref:Uncharacterized protein n=1 Tax=Entomophthora muscae TaxID=34485 RepID=A0ACC2S3L3_9FUNG|nr:hypothetical protein DSO57_1026924 [Entomophthora muscae]
MAAQVVKSVDVSSKQALVDEHDAQVLSAMSECCSNALGTYSVSKIKLSPDQYASCLQECTRPANAVTLFKRSCKTVASGGLLSCNPSIDATKNAALYFKEVFAQPNTTLCGVTYSIQQCHGSLCPEIVEFFSASNVSQYISRYPSAVYCGSNSIHSCILKALLSTKVDEVLFCLFTIYIMSGITPHH